MIVNAVFNFYVIFQVGAYTPRPPAWRGVSEVLSFKCLASSNLSRSISNIMCMYIPGWGGGWGDVWRRRQYPEFERDLQRKDLESEGRDYLRANRGAFAQAGVEFARNNPDLPPKVRKKRHGWAVDIPSCALLLVVIVVSWSIMELRLLYRAECFARVFPSLQLCRRRSGSVLFSCARATFPSWASPQILLAFAGG